MSATEATLQFFATLSDRWSRRIEKAQGAFTRVRALEKLRTETKTHSPSYPSGSEAQRFARGWMVDEAQSVAHPLFEGGNTIEGVELRLVAGALYGGSKLVASNDYLEVAGRRYLVKILPAHAFNEGELS